MKKTVTIILTLILAFALILALLLVVTLGACGEKKPVISNYDEMEMSLSESDKTPGYHTTTNSEDKWLNFYCSQGWEIVGFYSPAGGVHNVVYYVPSAEEDLDSFPMENYYPLLTRIIDLDYDKDLVTVEDANGFHWQFSGCDDWALGDLCNLLMFDNYTSDRISDDVIVRTLYTNFPKEVIK